MTMKQGIQNFVNAALDTKDEIAEELLDHGIDPRVALKISSSLTKRSIAEKLERHLENKNASEITHALNNHSSSNQLS